MPPSNRANTPAIRYATVAAATSHWRSDTSGLTPGLEYEVDEIRAALDFLRSPGVAAIVADERGGLSTRYGLRTFVARMNRIAAIAANGDTLAGQGGAG